MKRAHLVFLGAALLALVIPVAYAQDNFPDVPQGHWAYDALKILRDDGLLVGYPGGEFRGERPLSRYEFAVAMASAYKRLMNMMAAMETRADALQRRIDEIQAGQEQMPEVTKQELEDLKAALAAVRTEMSDLSGYQDDIKALQDLAQEFGRELASLGVDAAAIKRELASMEGRLRALENRKEAVNITGDVNLVGVGKHSLDGLRGVDWTGNPVGTNAGGAPAGIADDLHMFGELGLQIGTTVGRGVRLDSDVIIGDVLDYNFNSFSQLAPGQRRSADQTSVFINRLSAEWDAQVFGNPATFEIGRFGKSVSPYILRRLDPDPYTDIARYDNGEYGMDGGRMTLDFETVNLDVFAAKQSGRGDTTASSVYTMTAGDNRTFFDHVSRPAGVNQGLMTVNTELGAQLGVNFGRSSAFNLAYVVFDGDRTTAPAGLANSGFTFNRVSVFGGSLRVNLAETIFVDAQFSQAQLFENGSSRLNKDNFAYDVGVYFESDEDYNFGVGWKEIRPFFAPPGYWGRIGFWHSPTDLQGLTVGGMYRLTSIFDLTAQGEFYQGTGRAKDNTGTVVGLGTDDRVNRLQFGVGYRVNPRWKVLFGWEGVYWDLQDRPAGFGGGWLGGKPTEAYYTLGLDFGLGAQSNLRMLYQLSDYDGKNITGFNTPGNSDTRAKGGILVTQLSVEF